MGANNTRVKLPHLTMAVHGVGQIVNWVSDPVHRNTIKVVHLMLSRRKLPMWFSFGNDRPKHDRICCWLHRPSLTTTGTHATTLIATHGSILLSLWNLALSS